MNIYFCGSISGGRELLPAYRLIVDNLQHYGRVLTEHVADQSLTAGGEIKESNQAIFKRDLTWLYQADCMVAEVTTPSLGVGYEIAVGVSRNIPVFALFHKKDSRRLSALISGNPGLQLYEYRHIHELASLVKHIMETRNITSETP